MNNFTLDEAHEAWPSLESVTLLKARLNMANLGRQTYLVAELAAARNRLNGNHQRARDYAEKTAPPPRSGYAAAFDEMFRDGAFREFVNDRAAQDAAYDAVQRKQRHAPARTAEQLKALELARKCRAMEASDNANQAAVARRKTDDVLAKAGLTRGDL